MADRKGQHEFCTALTSIFRIDFSLMSLDNGPTNGQPESYARRCGFFVPAFKFFENRIFST